MIVVFKKGTDKEYIEKFDIYISSLGYEIKSLSGNVVEISGDTSYLDNEKIRSFGFVESVTRTEDPYKKVSRESRKEDTVIKVGDTLIGKDLCIIAGPCSVENEKQIIDLARSVKKAGASMIRGGAFKPRTSPYSFQGLGEKGIKLLLKAKEETGLPVVSEIISKEYIDEYENIDIIQVGARNMQNYDLLKALGRTDKPILLKRGMGAGIEELLMSAEYILSEGNEKVILCERGIKTFETMTRNTLDVSAVALLKKLTHLPVIADPSHACGMSSLVRPLSLAAVAAGASGIMLEVHNDPEHAFSDGAQAIKPEELAEIAGALKSILAYVR